MRVQKTCHRTLGEGNMKKKDLPNDVEELKDIIQLQLEEIKSLQNKLRMYASGKFYNIKFNTRTKNY